MFLVIVDKNIRQYPRLVLTQQFLRDIKNGEALAFKVEDKQYLRMLTTFNPKTKELDPVWEEVKPVSLHQTTIDQLDRLEETEED